MKDHHLELLRAMADCNLNVAEVSRKKFIHRNTINYQLSCIRRETGLDPQKFWDLKKLLEEYDQ